MSPKTPDLSTHGAAGESVAVCRKCKAVFSVGLDNCPACTFPSRATDMVNHPPHYKSKTGLESIDVIEAFGLGFHLGNAVKYILRSGKKGDAVEDLRKAAWYLEREIARLKK